MILFICEHCGKWLDTSFAQMLTDAFRNMPGFEQPRGTACPNGCGLMRQVQPTDKLCILENIRSNAVGRIEFEHEGKHYRGELFEVKRAE